jgi:hypothetical protein
MHVIVLSVALLVRGLLIRSAFASSQSKLFFWQEISGELADLLDET